MSTKEKIVFSAARISIIYNIEMELSYWLCKMCILFRVKYLSSES